MAYEEIEQEITGKNIEECRDKLFKLYGRDYRILNKNVDFRPVGILGLRKKPVTVVTYVVNHPKPYDEEEILQKNREAIMQNQASLLVKNQFSQITQMNSTLEEINKKFNELAASSQDKHETIKKIDNMLEQNEFSFSYIQMI